MSKKTFKGGLSSLLDNEEHTKIEPSKKTNISNKSTSILKRATFILPEELLEKMKAMSFWERKKIKTVLENALNHYFSSKGTSFMKEITEEYRKSK